MKAGHDLSAAGSVCGSPQHAATFPKFWNFSAAQVAVLRQLFDLIGYDTTSV